MIEQLFKDASIEDDGVNVSFELNGFKFRFMKSGKGLMRKRRLAASVFNIGANPDDSDLDAINAFMVGFSIQKGEDKWNINDSFSLDDFFSVVPEVENDKPIQLEMMNSLHVTAAMAKICSESAEAAYLL